MARSRRAFSASLSIQSFRAVRPAQLWRAGAGAAAPAPRARAQRPLRAAPMRFASALPACWTMPPNDFAADIAVLAELSAERLASVPLLAAALRFLVAAPFF